MYPQYAPIPSVDGFSANCRADRHFLEERPHNQKMISLLQAQVQQSTANLQLGKSIIMKLFPLTFLLEIQYEAEETSLGCLDEASVFYQG